VCGPKAEPIPIRSPRDGLTEIGTFPGTFPGSVRGHFRSHACVLVRESWTAGFRQELRGGQYCTGDTRLVMDPSNPTHNVEARDHPDLCPVTPPDISSSFAFEPSHLPVAPCSKCDAITSASSAFHRIFICRELGRLASRASRCSMHPRHTHGDARLAAQLPGARTGLRVDGTALTATQTHPKRHTHPSRAQSAPPPHGVHYTCESRRAGDTHSTPF
jgi:hypothetical protein